jgi:dienelactone hydrolase
MITRRYSRVEDRDTRRKGSKLFWCEKTQHFEAYDYEVLVLVLVLVLVMSFQSCCGSTRDDKRYVTPPCLVPSGSTQPGELVVEPFPVTFEGAYFPHAHIAYVAGRGPAPVILVHHNYAGLKQFDIDQACFLAKAGYVAVAVDLYPDEVLFEGAAEARYGFADRSLNSGPLADLEGVHAACRRWAPSMSDREIDALFAAFAEVDPSTGAPAVDVQHVKHRTGSFELMNQLYLDPARWRRLMARHLELAFEHPAVAANKSGAIGYCLGGQSCLEQVRGGHAVQAVVLFHGLLNSRPLTPAEPYNALRKISESEYRYEGVTGYWDAANAPIDRHTPGCRILIENGSLDRHVPPESLAEWESEMGSAPHVQWRFDNHGGADHGFALGPGVVGSRYDEDADRRSTEAMLHLFAETWPHVQQHRVECNASGTSIHLMPSAISATDSARRWWRCSNAALALATMVGFAAGVVVGTRR